MGCIGRPREYRQSTEEDEKKHTVALASYFPHIPVPPTGNLCQPSLCLNKEWLI